MLVDTCRLRMKPETIGNDEPLFGEEGLGLDSVDALEIVAGIEKTFGVVVESEEGAREIFVSADALTAYLAGRGALS